MALKKIDENPKITDTIVFELTTPNAEGCLTSDPYKVENLTIYLIERDYQKLNFGEYERVTVDSDLLAKTEEAEALACSDPTEENIANANTLRNKLEEAKRSDTFYFRDIEPVKVVGTALNPAWLTTDTDNALIEKVDEDEDGDTIYGHFKYEWTPEGDAKEGDYFICWTWAPLIAGETLSAHIPFNVGGDTKAVSSLPIHRTVDDKYETLLERYLPEMYKTLICVGDLTPDITERLNQSIADGFTTLEDLANQIIDLFDANVLHQSMLVYLSNLFAQKLKSTDPTLWRRQIKRSMPLYKKKGTKAGLEEAFAQAGMRLDKCVQYWQVVSPYTWQESFKVEEDLVFQLEKEIVLPIDLDNFKLYHRLAGEDDYTELSSDYVSFSEDEDTCIFYMTWVGEDLSANPIALATGDYVRVLYEYKNVPNSSEQQVENFIQTLPLADQRDEADQDYPPKNWNVRLIEEDDVMFDVVVPVRHPFQEPLIFGQIRTEFPYSENIYNMEEYNGSTRDSIDPCYIDKSFRDPCGSCLGSKFTSDVAITNLTTERLVEAQEIIDEYTPFHAVSHSINFAGEVNEFVMSPIETIETLVTITGSDKILSGKFNPIFHRVMEDGLTDLFKITREELADDSTVITGASGTAYNDRITIVAPDVEFDDVGIASGSHVLEILSPHPHAGTYFVDRADKSTAVIISPITEPITQTQFTFNLANVNYSSTSTTITQDDLYEFTDANINFSQLATKSTWDIANTPDYTGGAWKLDIPAYGVYLIDRVDPNGVLIISDDGALPAVDTTGISYTLKDDSDVEIASSSTGALDVSKRALVDLNDSFLIDTAEVAVVGDVMEYDDTEYDIVEFVGNNFYISEYSDGDVVGADITIRRKLFENEVGIIGYRGLRLITASDHESGLGILNGENAPSDPDLITDNSKFIENYLFKIDGEYYKIQSIDGVNVVLDGEHADWTTLGNGGTSVTYDLLHFEKEGVEIKFDVFDQIDRGGHDVLERQIFDQSAGTVAINILQAGEGSEVQDIVSQEEGISFSIEWLDGETTEGEL